MIKSTYWVTDAIFVMEYKDVRSHWVHSFNVHVSFNLFLKIWGKLFIVTFSIAIYIIPDDPAAFWIMGLGNFHSKRLKQIIRLPYK